MAIDSADVKSRPAGTKAARKRPAQTAAAAGRVSVVAPIWGRRHIDRYLGVVLPTWLSPGNLPALAAEGPVTVRFMTRRIDENRLRTSRQFETLARYVSVEFSYVDDLMSPDFVPVTLTLALHRGVALEVEAGSPARCLLLNSDFALADGALAYAGQRLRAGAGLLLAPSLRVTEETMAPLLQERVDADRVACWPARDLVDLALDHLHHTVLSSRADQSWLRSRNAHQLYWRVDENTLIARAFCMFALGVTVDRLPEPVAAYCDFGMGLFLAGDVEPEVMDHSDRFVALEIASEDYEQDFTGYGRLTPTAAAARLQEWTTDFHRRQADSTIVWCSADPGPSLAAVKARSDAFIDEVRSRLGPPLPLRQHPNWTGGLDGWRRARRAIGVHTDPDELAAAESAPSAPHRPALVGALRKTMLKLLVGGRASRRFWQPYWPLHRALHDRLGRLDAGTTPYSIAGPTGLLSYDGMAPLRGASKAEAHGMRIVGVDLEHPVILRHQLNLLRTRMEPGTDVLLFAFKENGGPISPKDFSRMWEGADSWLEIMEFHGMELRLDTAAERAYGRLADRFSLRRPLQALLLALVAAAYPPMLVARNLLRPLITPQKDGVTAIVISARPHAGTAAQSEP